jgi:hypothetical protein
VLRSGHSIDELDHSGGRTLPPRDPCLPDINRLPRPISRGFATTFPRTPGARAMTDNHVHFTRLDFLGVRGLELLSTRIFPLCILEFMCDHSHISASLIYFLHDPTLFMQPASEMLTQAAPQWACSTHCALSRPPFLPHRTNRHLTRPHAHRLRSPN